MINSSQTFLSWLPKVRLINFSNKHCNLHDVRGFLNFSVSTVWQTAYQQWAYFSENCFTKIICINLEMGTNSWTFELCTAERELQQLKLIRKCCEMSLLLRTNEPLVISESSRIQNQRTSLSEYEANSSGTKRIVRLWCPACGKSPSKGMPARRWYSTIVALSEAVDQYIR